MQTSRAARRPAAAPRARSRLVRVRVRARARARARVRVRVRHAFDGDAHPGGLIDGWVDR